MLIFNNMAVVILVAVTIVSQVVRWVFNSTYLVDVSALAYALAIDVILRCGQRGMRFPAVHPNAGGHVFFIPVWLIGSVVMLYVFWP